MNPDQKTEELKAACQLAIEVGQQYGAEIYTSANFGIQSKINFEKNDYNIATHHEGAGLSITLYKDQKSGSTSINTLASKDIQDAVKKCLEISEYSVQDPLLSLAPKSNYIDLPLFFDPSIVQLSMGDLKKATQTVVDLTTSNRSILIDNISSEKNLTCRVIANSNGMMAHDYNASLNWFIMGMAKSGDEITSLDYHGDYAYNTNKLEDQLQKSATTFQKKVTDCLHAQTGHSYQGQVLFPPSLIEEFILDPLTFHLKGSNIMDDKSRWSEHLGQAVTHPNLTIEDHPHDIELRGHTAFSGEGIPTQSMTLIEKGVLKTQVDSVYSAKKRGTRPTGNGSGPHAAVIPNGQQPWKELIDQEKTIIIPARFSGNFDPLSGDFSGIAKGSQSYKNGQHMGCLKETMIAGNIFEILKRDISLSLEQEIDFGYHKLPYALLDGISVTST